MYSSRYSELMLLGEKKRGREEMKQVHFPNSWAFIQQLFGLNTRPMRGNVTVRPVGHSPVLHRTPESERWIQPWQDVILRTSKSSVVKSWNEGLKCQHKYRRWRVWPLGSAIPSVRPGSGFLGQGERMGGIVLIALVPKAKNNLSSDSKIKQAYGSTSCGKKKVDACFQFLHQEDNKAVSSYTDRQVVGLTTQVW